MSCATPLEKAASSRALVTLLEGYEASLIILDESTELIAALRRELLNPSFDTPEKAEAYDLKLQKKRQALINDSNILYGRIKILAAQTRDIVLKGHTYTDEHWLNMLIAMDQNTPLEQTRKVSTIQSDARAGVRGALSTAEQRWEKTKVRPLVKSALAQFVNQHSTSSSRTSTSSSSKND